MLWIGPRTAALLLGNMPPRMVGLQTTCWLFWLHFRARCSTTLSLGCWRNGFKRPVLKHGPRSPTHMRVFGWQTRARNESKCRWDPLTRCTIDRSGFFYFLKDLSKSIFVGTRKMVNYAWIGWSQRKLWWKLVAVLTCKSIVKFGYRGERLIEPSSSWFPPKFPSG